jgi:hypothetical protein
MKTKAEPTDDEEIIGVGKKAHAGRKGGAQVEKADGGVVQGIDDTVLRRVARCGVHMRVSLSVLDSGTGKDSKAM